MSRPDATYCGDPWCDGDHVSATERCEPEPEPVTEQVDLLQRLADVLGVEKASLPEPRVHHDDDIADHREAAAWLDKNDGGF